VCVCVCVCACVRACVRACVYVIYSRREICVLHELVEHIRNVNTSYVCPAGVMVRVFACESKGRGFGSIGRSTFR